MSARLFVVDGVILGLLVVSLTLAVMFAERPGLVAALLAGGAVSLWLLYRVPKWQAAALRLGRDKSKELFDVENEARRTLATMLGGAALLASLYFTSRQLQEQGQQASKELDQQRTQALEQRAVEREGQITQRYIDTLAHLGTTESATVSARVGAILALERIARDSPVDHSPIIQLLASFVRERSIAVPLNENREPVRVAEDIRMAVRAIARRELGREQPLLSIDLSRTNLAGMDLEQAHLEYVSLRGADLRDANLRNVHLCGADLSDSDLSGADLTAADLRLTLLTGSSVTGWRGGIANPETRPPKTVGARFDGARMELMNVFPLNRWNRFLVQISREASLKLVGVSPAAATDMTKNDGIYTLLSTQTALGTEQYDIDALRRWRAEAAKAFPGESRSVTCAAMPSAAWQARPIPTVE
jgi:hypothetical protein